jgi:toxin ParE1/3/4
LRRVIFSRRAHLDLIGILKFSRSEWGDAAAEAYVMRFDDAVALLAENPFVATPVGDVASGYRRSPVGVHRLYFQMRGEDVMIRRVLHERMDANAVLAKS